MAVIQDPFHGLIDGILQGHAIAHQLRQQSLQEEQFQRSKERDAREAHLQDMQMQHQDLQDRVLNNKIARPIVNGLVQGGGTGLGGGDTQGPAIQKYQTGGDQPDMPVPQDTGAPYQATDALDQLRNLPTTQERVTPFTSYRVPDKTRKYTTLDSQGNKQDFELKSDDEQKQSLIDDEIKKQSSLADAASVNEFRRGQFVRKAQLASEAGGVPSRGFTSLGVPDGTPLTRAEFTQLALHQASLEKEGRIDVAPGHNIYTPMSPEQRAAGGTPAPGTPPGLSLIASGGPEKQTPEEDYLDAAAKKLGLKSRKEMSQEQQNKALGEYAQYHGDPVLRNLAVQSKQLQEQMLKLQQGNMPTPDDYKLFAQSLLDRSLSPTQFAELKAGRMGNLQPGRVFRLAKEMDPTYSMARSEFEFKAMEQTEKDFTSGNEATLVRANNNVLEHLGLLDQAGQALKNGDIPALNSIANAFGVATGKSAKTTYDLIAKRVSAESEKAFVPGAGSAAERAAGSTDFSSNLNPEQRQNNIRATIHLHDSQQHNLVDQYTRGTYGQGQQKLFTPSAMATRDRLLGNGGAAALPNGGGKPADAKTIQQFLDANSNDKEKTRKALTDAGWTIPKGN